LIEDLRCFLLELALQHFQGLLVVQLLFLKNAGFLTENVFDLTEKILGWTSTIFEMVDDARLRKVTKANNVVLLKLLSHYSCQN
jgi:hypothetical protein